MKHISSEKLDKLEGLLAELRKREGLKEKKRGVFYRKSKAFLHFHEDPAGLFVDVRLGPFDFDRECRVIYVYGRPGEGDRPGEPNGAAFVGVWRVTHYDPKSGAHRIESQELR